MTPKNWKVKFLWPILCLYFWGPEAMRGNNFKEKKVIPLIFTQFWIRSHLNQLVRLTPQDVYHLSTGYVIVKCKSNLTQTDRNMPFRFCWNVVFNYCKLFVDIPYAHLYNRFVYFQSTFWWSKRFLKEFF